MRLENKIAIITGAGSGMGRAASLLFAREGAKIAAIDINQDSAEETAKRIKSEGGSAFALRADVSLSADTTAMVDETIKRLGVPNILYNNAGIEGEGNFMAQLSEEGFDRVIAINLRGVWLGMKAALPHMVRNGGGVIINTASIAGMVAVKGAAAYCASKAGVLALTRVAAMEYGRYNIRVNAICPAAMPHTNFTLRSPDAAFQPKPAEEIAMMASLHPLGRAITAEDCAAAAAFLASDEALNITGVLLPIDGGFVAR